jgi:NAD kinase
MTLAPRVVVVHRRTEVEELVARHGSRGQAEFFLRGRGRSMDEVDRRAAAQAAALAEVAAAVPADWRRGAVERAELDRFLFTPEDVVVAVGQDGLVANLAGYLDGQPVIGVDPEPGRNPGLLVPHRPADVAGLLRAGHREQRTMVEATTDDGQTLRALNEVYIGHPTHQSARYRLSTADGRAERQSSSGILVGTGTGATGWCRSVALATGSALALPEPTERRLVWFVREAWPSPATGTDLTEGELTGGALTVTAETDGLVVFGDGIERDRLTLAWGQTLTVRTSDRTLALVAGPGTPRRPTARG